MRQNEIKEILSNYKTVAVVGLSREAGKDSHRVSVYLKQHGFNIIPVNPFADEILGEKSYKSLMEIPPEIQKTIEIVDVFRPWVFLIHQRNQPLFTITKFRDMQIRKMNKL